MRQYIDAINKLYESELTPLEEALESASEFEIDLILETMDDEMALNFNRKLMEFNKPSNSDVGLMTKIGAKVFGQQWAAERQGAQQALDDKAKFNADWAKFSKRFNLEMTEDNLKQFLKTQYKMGDETYETAVKQVKPETDRATGVIDNIDEFIPALSFAYFYGVGDAIEKRAEEKQIDIDALGYDDLPNNETSGPASPQAAAVAGDATEQGNTAPQTTEPGNLSASQISTKMGRTLGSLHVSAADRQQAMNDAKKGFNQSFSKNSRTLAAIGYSYLKAINAA